MSADLEMILNDLIMRAERTSAEFRREMATAQRIEHALERVKYLNAKTINEAIALLQFQPTDPGNMQPMPQFLNRVSLPN